MIYRTCAVTSPRGPYAGRWVSSNSVACRAPGLSVPVRVAVPVGVRVERGSTGLRAEVEDHAVVLTRRGGRLRIDLHAADGVGDKGRIVRGVFFVVGHG